MLTQMANFLHRVQYFEGLYTKSRFLAPNLALGIFYSNMGPKYRRAQKKVVVGCFFNVTKL